jgi:predicted DNA-binding transcriptional regulator AlpA
VTSAPENALTSPERNTRKLREFISERELSEWLGISQPTLSRHRRLGTGPDFVRLSARRVAYRRSSVEAWLSKHAQPARGVVGAK